ncbi:MAG: ribosome silencing factor [Oscillospiraceae bacterium]|jgi:ribosome-associated protein|nr:ribosome silencing factor [Oscillospiraceae bacterium]MBR4346354.1 ribosome silencing factor [Oscillospiraceae bacterium]
MDEQKQLIETAVKALDGKRAEDIRVIKITDLTIIADYFIIADGTSTTQVKALADEIEYKVEEGMGRKPLRVQGHSSGWVVIDYGDIVIHVFYKEQRDFYKLERLWADGEDIDISEYLVKEN